MRRTRRNHIGRVRWKLFRVLQEHGFSIPTPDCFWMQEGGYRHHYWDLARWGADWRDETGAFFTVYSWDTMTDCATHGINMSADSSPNTFEIHALPRTPKRKTLHEKGTET